MHAGDFRMFDELAWKVHLRLVHRVVNSHWLNFDLVVGLELVEWYTGLIALAVQFQ